MATYRKTDIQFLLNNTRSDNDPALCSSPVTPARNQAPTPIFHPFLNQLPPIAQAPSILLHHRINQPPPISQASAIQGLELVNTVRNEAGFQSVFYYRNKEWQPKSLPIEVQLPVQGPPTTRRKFADPKIRALDPEFKKRRYVCKHPNCGYGFKQNGGKTSTTQRPI